MADEKLNHEGHPNRECGAHRMVSPLRSWCLECAEWCYADMISPCKGCELPTLRAEISQLQTKLEVAKAALDYEISLHRDDGLESVGPICSECEGTLFDAQGGKCNAKVRLESTRWALGIGGGDSNG